MKHSKPLALLMLARQVLFGGSVAGFAVIPSKWPRSTLEDHPQTHRKKEIDEASNVDSIHLK